MNSAGPEPQFVKNLFGDISKTYDRANDVITFGMARLWRRALVEWSHLTPTAKVLDCATGTGDLAIEFKKLGGANVEVIGTDFCEGMLELAPQKAADKNCAVKFEVADVMSLPYQDKSFDIVSIAYGIRNVADRKKGIAEMARVLVPGGRLMILETGDVENPVLKRLIRFYFESCVPRLGGLVSGRRDAYEYLQKSSGAFPSGEAFRTELLNSGLFDQVEYRPIMGGASFIYRCQLPFPPNSDL